MSPNRFLFTSESVSEGHPDKMCDQISDAVLDAYLAQDPDSRVACEVLVKTGVVMVAGEITSRGRVDISRVARQVVKEIGFDCSEKGFDGNTCSVQVAIEPQSPDISQGVTAGQGLFAEQGAGDQGMMFGYAVNETPVLMPMSIHYAHRLMEQLAVLRRTGRFPWIRPDSKSQVTVEYCEGRPCRIHTVVVSTQHADTVTYDEIRDTIIHELVRKTIPEDLLDDRTHFYVNPTGKFVLGGPFADCGLTGRKIIVDSYGGHGAHGGGAFSGKDPSKVDRSAAYLARYAAKNIVAAGFADRCLVQLAYAIGVAQPVSIMVDTGGTGRVADERLAECVGEVFPVTPSRIIEGLDLKRPIYRKTASYGHFGRELPEFTWERTDRVDAVRSFLG
ncbi:MAG: methionine adenosyltransferase [Deltaproteobacteria bacterium]|nr:methionine adenosyltransferase [Deltaproteobacteria bacterium]